MTLPRMSLFWRKQGRGQVGGVTCVQNKLVVHTRGRAGSEGQKNKLNQEESKGKGKGLATAAKTGEILWPFFTSPQSRRGSEFIIY